MKLSLSLIPNLIGVSERYPLCPHLIGFIHPLCPHTSVSSILSVLIHRFHPSSPSSSIGFIHPLRPHPSVPSILSVLIHRFHPSSSTGFIHRFHFHL
ncbi:hypothetical protein AVEN_141768-1 [Araneus ventricosus]|uniref:Uncharacterized protein n=1 Tax=Araneus ventricosus TaxID=182803 RepID=A0A4Y2WML5_ARAVE|nr:hypothetical protein AVEN_141768-1 [Araneus ventricosus]